MGHGVIEGKDTGWMHLTPAWHRLFDVGKKRPKGIPAMRKVSGLTWDVESVEFIPMPTLRALAKTHKDLAASRFVTVAAEHAAPQHRTIIRDDTREVLGQWSSEGSPIRNRQGFEFAEGFLGELLPEALFSIRGGRNVCLLFEKPEWIEVAGDKMRRFLYLRLDHSGGGAMLLMFTMVRVQCANTDRMALDEAKARDGIYRIRHMGDVSMHLQEAGTALGVEKDYAKQFKRFGDRLGRQKLAERKLADVVMELWPPASDGKRAIKSAADRKDLVLSIFRGESPKGDTTGNAPGTKWCGYNAITEFVQHHQPVRVSKDTSAPEAERVEGERRFVRSTEDPDGIQSRALDLIVAA